MAIYNNVVVIIIIIIIIIMNSKNFDEGKGIMLKMAASFNMTEITWFEI